MSQLQGAGWIAVPGLDHRFSQEPRRLERHVVLLLLPESA
jgi:hypothetical protein